MSQHDDRGWRLRVRRLVAPLRPCPSAPTSGTEACARTPFAASASALSSNGGGTQSWGGVPMSATPAKSPFRHDQYASPRTTGRQAEESRGSPRRFAVTLGQGKGDVEAQPRRVGTTPTPVAVVGRCGAVSVGLCWPRHRPFLTGHGQRVPRLRQAYRQGCPGGRGTGCGVQGRARPPAASLACRPRGARRVVSRVCRVGAPRYSPGGIPLPARSGPGSNAAAHRVRVSGFVFSTVESARAWRQSKLNDGERWLATNRRSGPIVSVTRDARRRQPLGKSADRATVVDGVNGG